MREIRFRAWDKKDKVMINADSLAFSEYAPVSILFEYAKRDFEVMQYTGLKYSKRTEEFPDGQEIYEGDIVKSEDVYGIISFGAYGDEKTDYGFYVKWDKEKAPNWREDLCFWLDKRELEVIGNIYENESLLKGGE